jgi:hypothetical protein
MSGEIILPKDFVISNMSYAQPKQQNNGGKTIYISYSGKQMLMQTPMMPAPFGISVWPSENGGPDKYNIDVSFDNRESKETVQQFYTVLEAIDKQVVKDAMDNSQLWFKKRFPSVDVVEALYTPTIKLSKDKNTGEVTNQYAPKFKMVLPLKDNKFAFPAYDSNRNVIDLFDVIRSEGRGKGSRVQAIVMCSAVWIVGTKFGVTWKVRQLRLSEAARMNPYAFVSTGDDDDDVVPSEPAKRATATPLLLEDSDDENDVDK